MKFKNCAKIRKKKNKFQKKNNFFLIYNYQLFSRIIKKKRRAETRLFISINYSSFFFLRLIRAYPIPIPVISSQPEPIGAICAG